MAIRLNARTGTIEVDGNEFALGNKLENEYDYNSNLSSTDPTAGRLKFNSGTPASITEMRIHDDDFLGNNMDWLLDELAVGDVLTIRSVTDDADYVVLWVDSATLDQTGWWRIPVAVVKSGTIFTNGDQVRISVTNQSGAVVGTDGTPSVNEVAFFNDGSTLAGSGGLTWNGSNFEVGLGNSFEVSSGTDNMVTSHDGTDINIACNNTTAINYTFAGTPNVGQLTFEGSLYLSDSSAAMGNISTYGQFRSDGSQGSGAFPTFTMDDGTEWSMHNTHSYTYGFDVATDATDPGSGDMKYDNATHSSVTNVYINDLDIHGRDMGFFLSNLGDGDILTIRGSFTTSHQVFSVNGAPTDNTGWWTIPVTVVNSTAVPDNNDIADIMVQWFSEAGGGTPTVITVADESTDTTCFPAFFTAATGDLGPKTSTGLTFNSNTHALGLTGPNTASTDVAHTISARGSAILNLIANTSDDDPGNNTAIIFSQDAGVDLANIGQSGEDDFGAEGEALNGAAIRDLVLHNREPTGISFGVNGQVGMRLNDSDNLAITGIASATTFSGSGASLTAIPVSALADGTDGELITWSAAGVATTVAVGSVDEVLTSGGVGVAPTFQALPPATQIVTDYVDAGSLTLSDTTFTTAMSVTLLEDINYYINIHFDVQAPSADDIKIRFSGIGASSSINASFHESETGGFEPIWATTAQTVSNTIVIPTNGGSNGQGLGTYCTIQGTVNIAGGDVTLVLQFAKNADTGADGFIRVYRGMTCIPIT